ASGKSMTADASSCFPAGYPRYVINGGTAAQPYLVDAETIVRLSESEVTGTGYVKWKDYIVTNYMAGPAAFTGVIPVEKLNDPIFTSMALPAEANYSEANLNEGSSWNSSNNRINGKNMVQPRAEHTSIVNMGAIFMAYDENRNPLIDPDQDVTVCLKNFRLLLHSTAKSRDWFLFQETAVPDKWKVNHFYALPWSSDSSRNKAIPDSQLSYSDHTELKLKGSDFRNDDPNDDIVEYTLHVWAVNTRFDTVDASFSATDVDGVVCAYTVWIKEAGAANKFIATVGADLRPGSTPEGYNSYTSGGQTGWKDSNSSDHMNGVNQLLSSRAYLVPNEPRTIVSHNVYQGIYDSVMDTDRVQQLLEMK
ncbi:MAG: hypothetical protein J6X61_00520, partial [Clostridia bacterium]|nr:hypothetical protein [Clostridia bacterium]